MEDLSQVQYNEAGGIFQGFHIFSRQKNDILENKGDGGGGGGILSIMR